MAGTESPKEIGEAGVENSADESRKPNGGLAAAGHLFGFLLAWAACLVICILVAPVTAQMAGFDAGGWSWNLMQPMAGGLVTAAVGYPICYGVTFLFSKRASAALALPIALVPILAAIVGTCMGRTQ